MRKPNAACVSAFSHSLGYFLLLILAKIAIFPAHFRSVPGIFFLEDIKSHLIVDPASLVSLVNDILRI